MIARVCALLMLASPAVDEPIAAAIVVADRRTEIGMPLFVELQLSNPGRQPARRSEGSVAILIGLGGDDLVRVAWPEVHALYVLPGRTRTLLLDLREHAKGVLDRPGHLDVILEVGLSRRPAIRIERFARPALEQLAAQADRIFTGRVVRVAPGPRVTLGDLSCLLSARPAPPALEGLAWPGWDGPAAGARVLVLLAGSALIHAEPETPEAVVRARAVAARRGGCQESPWLAPRKSAPGPGPRPSRRLRRLVASCCNRARVPPPERLHIALPGPTELWGARPRKISMRLIVFSFALLSAATAASAANICSAGEDQFKKQFLSQNAEPHRQRNHHWMALAKAAAPKWSQARLETLLIPGSHDAGSFGTPHSGTGKNAWAVTQSYSLLDQLCLGSRWFDVRLSKGTQGFRIFHGNFKFGTGESTLEQFAKFIEDPAHADEFAFVRLKLEAKPAEKAELYRAWIKRLGNHVVDKSKLPKAGKILGGGFAWLTPAQIKASNTGKGGRIFLLEYEKSGTNVPQELRKFVFSYPNDQAGTFSDKVPLADVTTEQQAKIAEFKAMTNKKGKSSGTAGKAFATWWTSTGGLGRLDVRNNTAPFWPKSKPSPGTPLEAFYASNECSIGTFLVVDFFGDTALQGAKSNLVMDLAFDHNVKTLNGLKPKLCAGNVVQAKGKKVVPAKAKAK